MTRLLPVIAVGATVLLLSTGCIPRHDEVVSRDSLQPSPDPVAFDTVGALLFGEPARAATAAEMLKPAGEALAVQDGLSIAAYAVAGRILGDAAMVDSAALAFSSGHLEAARRREASPDDVHMLLGAIELYAAGYDPEVLAAAVALADHITDNSAEDVEPGSATAVLLFALARLARLTGAAEYAEYAEELAAALGQSIALDPAAESFMRAGIRFLVQPGFEVVVVGEPGAEDTREMIRRLNSTYLPVTVVLVKDPSDDRLAEIAPFTQYKGMIGGRATAYVCENFSCKLPTNDPDVMMSLLQPGP
jgi:uncharacterized protein YyaL (SSP411 family)